MVTRDRCYLVHVVGDLHDSLLGEAQVEVLVPELQRDGDGERSSEQEQRWIQRGILAFLPVQIPGPATLTSVWSATMKSSMYFMVLQASLFTCKTDSKAWRSEEAQSASHVPMCAQEGWPRGETEARGGTDSLHCHIISHTACQSPSPRILGLPFEVSCLNSNHTSCPPKTPSKDADSPARSPPAHHKQRTQSWLYPPVHQLEEPGDVINSVPKVTAVGTGATRDVQVLCSVDEVVVRLRCPHRVQVVGIIAAHRNQAPGDGEQTQIAPAAPSLLTQSLPRSHRLSTPQLGYPGGQREEMGERSPMSSHIPSNKTSGSAYIISLQNSQSLPHAPYRIPEQVLRTTQEFLWPLTCPW